MSRELGHVRTWYDAMVGQARTVATCVLCGLARQVDSPPSYMLDARQAEAVVRRLAEDWLRNHHNLTNELAPGCRALLSIEEPDFGRTWWEIKCPDCHVVLSAPGRDKLVGELLSHRTTAGRCVSSAKAIVAPEVPNNGEEPKREEEKPARVSKRTPRFTFE